MPEFENYHLKCNLPWELCVCGGKDDPHEAISVTCGVCDSDYVLVISPGIPLSTVDCIRCKQKGYLKEDERE